MNGKEMWDGPAALAAFDQHLAEIIDIVRNSKGPLIICGSDEEDRLLMQTLICGKTEQDVVFTFAAMADQIMRRLVMMLNETVGPKLTSVILAGVWVSHEEGGDA